jgi:hypothetical protein
VVVRGRAHRPAFRFVGTHTATAAPSGFASKVWERERIPQVDGLEIVGDHEEADGIEFIQTMQATLRGVLVREVRHGVILAIRIQDYSYGEVV